MTVVAMDTNALMMPVECGVRVFEELDRLVPDADRVAPAAVFDELRKLSDSGGEEGVAASVGLDLATERVTRIETDEPYADDALVELAREGRVDYVVTNDAPLVERVLETGVPVIRLRGRNKLRITQP